MTKNKTSTVSCYHFFKRHINVPNYLLRCMRIWYHFYLNHLGGERLTNTIKQICYWKCITNQARQFTKCCKECQNHKKRASRYGKILPKNIAENEMKPWKMVHIDLIGLYIVKLNLTQPGGAVKSVDLHLTCMKFIYP